MCGCTLQSGRHGTTAGDLGQKGARGRMDPRTEAELVAGRGLQGDATQGGRRQVTIMSWERWTALTRDLVGWARAGRSSRKLAGGRRGPRRQPGARPSHRRRAHPHLRRNAAVPADGRRVSGAAGGLVASLGRRCLWRGARGGRDSRGLARLLGAGNDGRGRRHRPKNAIGSHSVNDAACGLTSSRFFAGASGRSTRGTDTCAPVARAAIIRSRSLGS